MVVSLVWEAEATPHNRHWNLTKIKVFLVGLEVKRFLLCSIMIRFRSSIVESMRRNVGLYCRNTRKVRAQAELTQDEVWIDNAKARNWHIARMSMQAEPSKVLFPILVNTKR